MKTSLRLTAIACMAIFISFVSFAQKKSPTADSRVVKMLVAKKKSPIKVTAKDLVTKVFGVADNRHTSKADIRKAAQTTLSMTPTEDEGNLWLDSPDGYAVSYYGMVPQVSAVAIYEDGNDEVSNYSYFFLFPYNDGARDNANYQQCAFCSTLLQELDDMGMDLGTQSDSDALFEAVGSYGDNLVNIRLMEQLSDASYVTDPAMAAGSGKYIVVLNIEPNAYAEADNWMAAE